MLGFKEVNPISEKWDVELVYSYCGPLISKSTEFCYVDKHELPVLHSVHALKKCNFKSLCLGIH
jgi:hypothetical protein